jgi:putative FmdB family regulatory protein
MALYEYRCPECEEIFDLFRPLADRDAPVACPNCGGRDARRELSRVSASVKGSANPCGSATPACGDSFG